MLRYFVLSVTAVAGGLALASPSQAAPDQSICTDTVWNDISGYTPENAELNAAIAELNSHGVDTRAVFIEDLGSGIDDVPEFERSVLQEICPQLFPPANGGDPKSDLLMLVVSEGDRQAGVVFGSQLTQFHNENRFSDVGDDYFRDGDYAGGFTAYIETVINRIEAPQQQPAPQTGSGQASSDDSSSGVSGKAVAITFGIIAGILVFAVLLILLVVYVKKTNARKARQRELLARHAEIKDRLSGLLLDEGRTISSDTTMQFLAYWIDKLPDSDDADIREIKERHTTCAATAGSLLDSAEVSIREATDQIELDEAEDQLYEASALVEDGIVALHQAEEACRRLADLNDQFIPRHTERLEATNNAINQLISLGNDGFIVQSYDDKLSGCLQGLADCRRTFDGGAIVTAINQLDDISEQVTRLQAAIDDLPHRAGRITDQAAVLRGMIEELSTSLSDATRLHEQLTERYDSSDLAGIETAPSDASSSLDGATASIEQALGAGSMERQAFDEADELLAAAGRLIDQAKGAISSVNDRAAQLEQLPGQLATSMDEQEHEAQQLIAYIDQVRSDVDDDTADLAGVLASRLGELKDGLRSSKPRLLELERELSDLDAEMDSCLDNAKVQHREMEQLRDEVKTARRRAKERLEEASSYSSYATSRYAHANAYFNGAIAGMTLQQQLNHWREAEDAADSAYSEGYRDYQDAHRPTYTSSSSSSSSDFGGGSSGHSFGSSSGGGGGGGSSGHGW